MSLKPIRLIATDIDGTLLDNNGRISDRNLRAIHAALEKGVQVAVASGRFPENVYVLLEKYGLRLPIIGANGGRIVDENLTVLSERRMDPAAARKTLEILIELGSHYILFGNKSICTSSVDRMHHSEVSYGERLRDLGFRFFHGPEEARAALNEPVYKVFVFNNVPLPTVRQALSAVPGIELTQSGASNIEVMPCGVDKGLGITDFARVTQIPLEQVMAVGDEENDIPMLSAVGWGVAMGNGSEKAKRAARYVTDTNAEDGFAKAIETYAL